MAKTAKKTETVEEEFEHTVEGAHQLADDVTKQREDSKVFRREKEIRENKLVDEAASIPFSYLTWGDNVRSTETLQLEGMIHSFKQRGYITEHRVVLSKKSANKYLVLCGNRRTEALKKLKETEPEEFKEILPDGKIPAVVYEDLTEDEEILIRNDHSSELDRVGLDDEGIFYAVKQLVKALGTESQADLAAKLNLYIEDKQTGTMKPNRSFIQQRVNLARLPDFVQKEFIKLMRDGKNSTNVRWSHVAKLFKLYKEGRSKGYVEDGGPEFQEFWEKCLHPSATETNKSGSGPKMLTKSEAERVSENLGSRLGQLFMLKVAGNPVEIDGKKVDWGDIDGEMVKCEQAYADITKIAKHLGKTEFKKLMKAAEPKE